MKEFSFQWSEESRSNVSPVEAMFTYIASLEVAKKVRHPSGARFVLRFAFGDDKPMVQYFKTVKKFREAVQEYNRNGVKFEVFRNYDKGVTVNIAKCPYY